MIYLLGIFCSCFGYCIFPHYIRMGLEKWFSSFHENEEISDRLLWRTFSYPSLYVTSFRVLALPLLFALVILIYLDSDIKLQLVCWSFYHEISVDMTSRVSCCAYMLFGESLAFSHTPVMQVQTGQHYSIILHVCMLVFLLLVKVN